jgi:hypothetical protein
MNKSGIIIVGSFLIGVGTGYLLAKQLLEQKYADLAQEEIDSVKEVFGRVLQPANENFLSEKEQEDMKQYEGMLEDYNKEEDQPESFRTVPSHLVRSSLDNNKSELAKKDYNISKPAKPPAPRKKKAPPVEESAPDPAVPYIIEANQYLEEKDEFDKIALVYYQDGVLMSEGEEMIDDVDACIGYDAFTLLTTGIRGPLWVRNETLQVDYEVVVMTQPYGEMMDPPSNGSMRRRTPHDDNDET